MWRLGRFHCLDIFIQLLDLGYLVPVFFDDEPLRRIGSFKVQKKSRSPDAQEFSPNNLVNYLLSGNPWSNPARSKGNDVQDVQHLLQEWEGVGVPLDVSPSGVREQQVVALSVSGGHTSS